MEFARIPCPRPSLARCRVMPMIPALDVVWASEGSVLKLRKPFNDAVATQFLIRVDTLNLGGLTQIVADEMSSMAKNGTTTASDF
jgi:hypothetical protein